MGLPAALGDAARHTCVVPPIRPDTTSAMTAAIAERDENLCRKPLIHSEQKMQADALMELERVAAKERQGRPGRPRCEESAQHAKSRDRVAAAVGTSHDTLTKINRVVRNGSPKLIKAMDERAAKERQKEHGGTAPGRKNTSAKLAGVNGESRAKIAAAVGMKPSPRTHCRPVARFPRP